MADDGIHNGTARAGPALELLPETALKAIIKAVVEAGGAQAIRSLIVVSKKISTVTLAACFETIILPDDREGIKFPLQQTKLRTLLAHKKQYAALVKQIKVVPSLKSVTNLDSDLFGEGPDLDGPLLFGLLAELPELQSVIWHSDRPPWPLFCAVLVAANPKLRELSVELQSCKASQKPPSPRLSELDLNADHGEESRLRWDPEGIEDLHGLRKLHLSRLSLEGCKVFSAAIPSLSELEVLVLDCKFIDDGLLAQVGQACKRLRHVRISTTGTKMTAKGLAAVFSGCYLLESVELVGVEGRLHRTTWTQIEPSSELFNSFKYVIDENESHHSWVTDHLDSVFYLFKTATARLTDFTVTRNRTASVETQGEREASRSSSKTPLSPVVQFRQLPPGAIDTIKNYGASLVRLNIDFFTVTEEDLKGILDACPQLRSLQICLDFSFCKLLGKSSLFTHSTHLAELNVSVVDKHCPWAPNDEVVFVSSCSTTGKGSNGARGLRSTPSSPDRRRKEESSPPRRMSSDGICSSGLGQGEPAVPPKREVRRFARRCPSLQVLRWIGRQGQGSWTMTQGSQHIDFIPAADQKAPVTAA